MKYLLGTAVWLWSLAEPERIHDLAREIIGQGRTELYLSAASSREISIKSALGKLSLPEPPARYVPKRLAAQGIRPLPTTHLHALAVADLPLHHRDPCDRILVAQAQIEEMTLLTADRAFDKYRVEVLWCG